MRNTNKGFTLIELLIVLFGGAAVALMITGIWIAVHFISKWW